MGIIFVYFRKMVHNVNLVFVFLLNNTSYVKKIMIDVTNEFEFSLKKTLYYHFNVSCLKVKLLMYELLIEQ